MNHVNTQQISLWAVDSVGADTILRDSNLHDLISAWAADTISSAHTKSRGIIEFLYEVNHDTRQSGDHLISEITVLPDWEQSADKRSVSEEVDPGRSDIKKEYALKAYPNPFSSHIAFEVPPVAGVLSMYSIDGALLDRFTVDGKDQQTIEYDAPAWVQGIYFAIFSSNQLSSNLHVRIVKL